VATLAERVAAGAAAAMLIVSNAGHAKNTPRSVIAGSVGGRCRFISINPQTNEEQVKNLPRRGRLQRPDARVAHARLFRLSRAPVADGAGADLQPKLWR